MLVLITKQLVVIQISKVVPRGVAMVEILSSNQEMVTLVDLSRYQVELENKVKEVLYVLLRVQVTIPVPAM